MTSTIVMIRVSPMCNKPTATLQGKMRNKKLIDISRWWYVRYCRYCSKWKWKYDSLVFVFPRNNHNTCFISTGPTGCIGSANQSGWMNTDTFWKFLVHCFRDTECTVERPVSLLLNDHESFLNRQRIDIVESSGVIILPSSPLFSQTSAHWQVSLWSI